MWNNLRSSSVGHLQPPSISKQPKWNSEIGLLILIEVQKAIAHLKRGRAAGTHGLTTDVFKDGGLV